jgi:hypothetical protein
MRAEGHQQLGGVRQPVDNVSVLLIRVSHSWLKVSLLAQRKLKFVCVRPILSQHILSRVGTYS